MLTTFAGRYFGAGDISSVRARALRLTSRFDLALALIRAVRSTLNGVMELICRIGLPMLTALIPGMSFWGVCWTAALARIISALFCLLRYISWWKKAQVSCQAAENA